MGMYTEFYFRANIKDGPVADWLERQIITREWFENGGYDDHEFFTMPRWDHVFIGGGAVYQESRRALFRRPQTCGPYANQLVLSSSLKDYSGEVGLFVDWITPHLRMSNGDFLGYELYEDSTDDSNDYREHPTLYFYGRGSVQA
ncbi:hypothetical protein M2272_005884 [Mycobacterium frederiksbergense]|uniref:Uncharacterized protein n=1 Tax=Mycolicibacterium frederiksbergense TaxID=117567 RepID=A0ABT6L9D1_9MYCO|nr:hypothetical protein [Mycolicibacterium frederiksbergense]MDH6199216.1 hypothetical protein [Mycolicibacterium frederiksbergense]